MKVLMLSSFYSPHIGGVERHVEKVNSILHSKGHKVTVITEKYDEILKSKESVNGVTIYRFSYPKIKFFGLLIIWLNLLLRVDTIRSSDIIHCHDVFIWYLPFRFLFPNKRVFTTFHGWEGVYPIPKKSILLKRLAAKLSNKNICVGVFLEIFYGIKANEVVYGAVDQKGYETKYKGSKSAIYLGRLSKDTGLPIVLNVVERLKGFRITFCGDGPLKEKCSRFGEVPGFVDPIEYLKKSNFCFPGGYLSTMEALFNKCLVFIAYENQLKETCFKTTPFAKWIVIERSPQKLVDKMKYYLDHPSEANLIREAGYDWVKEQTWLRMVNTYLKLWGQKKSI